MDLYGPGIDVKLKERKKDPTLAQPCTLPVGNSY
jgi:hypothetical protein